METYKCPIISLKGIECPSIPMIISDEVDFNQFKKYNAVVVYGYSRDLLLAVYVRDDSSPAVYKQLGLVNPEKTTALGMFRFISLIKIPDCVDFPILDYVEVKVGA